MTNNRRDIQGELMYTLYLKGENMLLRASNIEKGQQVPINMRPLAIHNSKQRQ